MATGNNIVNNRSRIQKLMYGGGETQTQEVRVRKQAPKAIVTEEIIAQHPNMPSAILEHLRGKELKDESTGNASIMSGFIPEEIEERPLAYDLTQQASKSPIIDYSLLKSIIDESVQASVKKYVTAMCNQLLKENKAVGLQTIQIGNKFNILTKDGTLFEAQLENRGNLNEIDKRTKATKNKKKEG